MKLCAATLMLIAALACLRAEGPTIVPPEPPVKEIGKKAKGAAIVLTCKPNRARSGLEVMEVIKGKAAYLRHQDAIAKMLPSSDPKALATKGFRELVFIRRLDDGVDFEFFHSLALWPSRKEQLGVKIFHFPAHDYAEIKRVVADDDENAQQAVDPNRSSAPLLKSESSVRG